MLAIQSTVAHGYVGNKCAIFPLQCLGFNVDAINTVSLSNHPNYPKGFKGQFLSPDEMKSTIQGLDDNSLLTHDLVLNGYTRNVDVLHAIKDTVQKLRKNNPNAIYICDPVLGDNGQYYVPEALLDVYKNSLIPLAHVITPNYFEVEVLTGMKVKSLEDAVKASSILHDLGTKIVIMTGQRLTGTANGETENGNQNQDLSILLSTRFSATSKPNSKCDFMLRIEVPQIPGYFHGCGDLFAALCASGVFRAVAASGGSLTAIEENQQNNVETFHKQLALMLDHIAWAITHVVADTYHAGNEELRIVESIDIYRKIKQDWLDKDLVSESHVIKAEDRNVSTDSSSVFQLSKRTMHDLNNTFLSKNAMSQHSIAFNKSYTVQPAYCAVGVGRARVRGVILDMDGTLTLPGLIDFQAMKDRIKLSTLDGSILSQIYAMPEEQRRQAFAIIEDEEEKGMQKMLLREDLHSFLSQLHSKRIRMAIATLNSEIAVNYFLQKANVSSAVFSATIHRDSLNGKMKPDPYVATSIMNAWGKSANSDESGLGDFWFIGDSLDDMHCGHLAGCKTCLLRTPFNRKVEAEHAGSGLVTFFADSLSDWLNHVSL